MENKLTLNEVEFKEVLSYLNDIPKKYADPLYNSFMSLYNEQNKEEKEE